MIIYSQKKDSLIELEKLIHSRWYYLESDYRCEKLAEILGHQNGFDFALPVDELALELIHIPDDCKLIENLPNDFYPEYEI